MPKRKATRSKREVLLGYARISADQQSTRAQVKALDQAGATRIFQEEASGGRWDRPELHRMLDQLRPGDVVLVWKLDRLSRSLKDLLHILEKIDAAGAGFRSLTEAIDTTNPAGRMMMQMLGAFAEFEREMIRERTRAGVEAARARGRVGGRPSKLTKAQQREALAMVTTGAKTGSEVARLFGVHPSTISRLVGQDRVEPQHMSANVPPEKAQTRTRLTLVGSSEPSSPSRRRGREVLPKVLQFKITLVDSSPRIWRRLLLPGDVSFWKLHLAIQDAMGWEGYHLHEWLVPADRASFESARFGNGPSSRSDGSEEHVAAWVEGHTGDLAQYTYDFGDNWLLDVAIEKTLTSTRRALPACTGGARRAPPEDSGGVHGFQAAIAALKKPRSAAGRAARELLGKGFRAAPFDPKKVQFEHFANEECER